MNLGIFVSGKGSNMLNIVNACREKKINCCVKIIVSNKECEGIQKARKLGLKTLIHKSKDHKRNYEGEILKQLNESNVDLVCLAGYMRILSKFFIKNWKKNIVNIHPSLLPAFKGINAQQQAINYGVKYSGCTIHYVNEKIDGGEIIDQSCVKIIKKDNVKSLSKKILIEEHKLYIKVLKLLSERFKNG